MPSGHAFNVGEGRADIHEPILNLSEEREDLALGQLRRLTRMGDAPIEIDAEFVRAAERLERRLRLQGHDDLANKAMTTLANETYHHNMAQIGAQTDKTSLCLCRISRNGVGRAEVTTLRGDGRCGECENLALLGFPRSTTWNRSSLPMSCAARIRR